MKRFLLFLAYISCCAAGANAQTAMGNWSNTGPISFPVNVSGQVNGIGRVSQVKFHPSDPQKMYAVSASGGLFLSSNNGQTWAPAPGTETLPQTSCSAVCIDYTNDQVLYLSLGDANYYSNNYGIYKSLDGGATWLASNTGIGTAMAVEILMDPANHNNLVAATKNGIYKTVNAGATWTQKQTGQFRDMKAKPGSNTTLYAATGSSFYISTDFGNTWTGITSGVTPPTGNDGMRIAVSAADTNIVYLGTTQGNCVIMKSVNSGQSFSTVYSSTTQCLNCYDANPSSGTQGDYNFDLNCNPQNANELLLVAHCVWRSTNGGITWSKRTSWPTEMHTDMHHVEWNPYNNQQRFCANDGGIYMSTDTVATNWNTRSDGLAATEIYHAAQNPVVRELLSIGTQDNGELYYLNGSWKTCRGGDWGARNIFDYRQNGSVYYMDKGTTRTLVPVTGDQSYNLPFTPNSNTRMDFVQSMQNMSFTGKDSIYRSSNINSSPSWSLIYASTETVKDIHSCHADSNILYVVTASGHLLRSINALAATPTFTVLNTPAATSVAASIATSKTNANIVYLTCGTGVYRSIDKGATWTNITGTGLSGLNIRKIIADDFSTGERLFVNAGSYVHYKDNTTTVWTNHTTNHGLPTVCNTSDFMIYNSGNAASILRLSTYGRGVWQCNINDNLPPAPDFLADKTICCPGDTVHFTQTIFGNPTSFSWSFPGGNPSSSTAANPAVVYTAAGTYAVSLTATNTNGTNTVTKTAYINVTYGQTTAIQEGFEGAVFPPAGWQLAGNSGSQWVQTATASGYGSSTKSILFDNYNIAQNGAHDNIIAPKADLSGITAARLTFDVAYAPYNSAQPDSLVVKVSTDCGKNWNTVYTKTGTALATAPAVTAAIFVPTASQWRTDTISLTPYINNPVLVSFENVGHYGQALYLDNVNIKMAPAAHFSAADTTVCAGSTVQFNDQSTGATAWSWSFPGGTPNSSNLQNPVITYATGGTYNVTLTASSNVGTGTLVKQSFVKVSPLPVPVISASGAVLTASGAAGTFQWYMGSTIITGATNSTYTAPQSGIYKVVVTDSLGCSGTSQSFNYVKTGIAGNIRAGNIEIYPNPSTGVITLKVAGITGEALTFRMYNMNGALIKQQVFRLSNGSLQQTINLGDIAKGVYETHIQTDKGEQEIRNIVLQ